MNILKQFDKQIIEEKHQLENTCSQRDQYVKDQKIDVYPLGNIFSNNRLNEFEQAMIWDLTLGNVGGGPDSEENIEFKTAEYQGVNKNTHLLNSHTVYFNGMAYIKNWKEQKQFMEDYLSDMKGLNISIRLPIGSYLHFESKGNKATRDILIHHGTIKWQALQKGLKDPRMRTIITTSELIDINNFKLSKTTDKTLAKYWLENTFDIVK
jgi:hypothetical protein